MILLYYEYYLESDSGTVTGSKYKTLRMWSLSKNVSFPARVDAPYPNAVLSLS